HPATVAGVSYGGWVGTLLAAKHPELVTGLVISGVRPEIPRYLAELQALAFRLTPTRELRRGEPVAMRELKIERANLVGAARGLAVTELWSSLNRVVAPTVVFAPSRDRLVRRQIPLVAAAVRDARVVPLPGAAHLWPVKDPNPLTEHIRALASLDRNDEQ